MTTNDTALGSAIVLLGEEAKLPGTDKIPYTGFDPENWKAIEANYAQISGGEESPGIPSGQPGAQHEEDASLARGLFGVIGAVTVGTFALTALTKGKFNPFSALVEAFDSFGAPRDPNETLGERYGSLIEESKRSDPNRDVAYGALGTKNSFSLPGTSWTHNISDEDVLGLTREEAEKSLTREQFQATNPDKESPGTFDTQAEMDTASVGVGTAAAAAAARGTSPSTDFGFGEAGSLSGSRSDSPTGGMEGDTSGMDSSAESSAAPGHGSPGAWNTGGRIGALIQHLQTGGEADDADTNMEVANVPMGVVNDADGAPGPFSGGTGVEDDLDMEVEAGSYVLNAEAVQLIGISDINAVIRDAYSIAAALGKEVPADYDPQNKVPIRISNGEAIIPKALVDIIGLDKLEKWNQKGLQLRKQKEKFMAQKQQQQPPQGPQVASEAPMQQQMGQLMAHGSLVQDENEEAREFFRTEAEKEKEAGEQVPIEEVRKFFKQENITSEDVQDETEEAREFFRTEAEKEKEAGEQVPIEEVRKWISEQENITPEELERMFRSEGEINKGITVKESEAAPGYAIQAETEIPILELREKSEDLVSQPNYYNARFGTNTEVENIYPLTKEIITMTLSEVLFNQKQQEQAIRDHNKGKSKKEQIKYISGAWGAYQIMPETLKWAMGKAKINLKTIFTPEIQDRLATELLRKRGVFDYIADPTKASSNLSTIQNNLAKEWRSLPNTDGVSESSESGQKIGIGKQEFRDILKRVQKLGPEEGVKLLLETIIMAEHAPRKNR